ncbi:hypothetical protein BGZ54_000618, partial [Gamsiella multidivaricata]
LPRLYPASLRPVSKPFQLHSIAPLSTITETATDSSKKLKEWTPELDIKLMNYRPWTNWDDISNSLGFSVDECKARLKTAHLQDERLKNWSMTLEASTEHEKSVPELVRLMGQGKTWSEIAGIMHTEEEFCRAQWAKLGVIYSMEHPKTLLSTKLMRALEDRRFKLSRHKAQEGSERPTTDDGKSLTGVELYDWDKISREVFRSRFSPEHLRYRFITLVRERFRWTAEDRDALYNFIERSLSARSRTKLVNGEPDWHKASQKIVQGRHSPYDCRALWGVFQREDRDRSKIQRQYPPWTASEILEFWKAWRTHGDNWTAIANSISSGPQPRTPSNCQWDFYFVIEKAQELQAGQGTDEDSFSQVFAKPCLRPRFSWTSEQASELHRIVQEEIDLDKQRQIGEGHSDSTRAPKIRWVVVAQKLDIGASGEQCRYFWLKETLDAHGYDPAFRRATTFQGHDGERLMELVQQYRPSGKAEWMRFQQKHFPMYSLHFVQHEYGRLSLKEMAESKTVGRQLEEQVLKHGEHSWKQVANYMSANGNYRTRQQCQKAWAVRRGTTTVQWSPEELDKLTNAVDDIQQKRLKDSVRDNISSEDDASLPKLAIEDWITIGQLFPSKTSVQCRSKWTEIEMKGDTVADVWDKDSNLDNLRKGPGVEILSSSTNNDLPQSVWRTMRWTPERFAVLRTAVEKYGGNEVVFEQVAQRLGTTSFACWSQWSDWRTGRKEPPKNFLWNEQYDKILLDTVAEHKKQGLTLKEAFGKVAKQLDGAKKNSPRSRWQHLMEVKKEQEALNG